MMNMSISNIDDYVKKTALAFKAKQRIDNPFMKKGGSLNGISEADAKYLEEQEKGERITTIVGKLKAGAYLSTDEIEYLRANDPETYSKAVKIAAEREEYKKQLNKSRTKDDVQRANIAKISLFAGEAKAVMGNSSLSESEKLEKMEFIQMRMRAVLNDHSAFMSSKKYQELPWEHELKEKNKKNGEDNTSEEIIKQAKLKMEESFVYDKNGGRKEVLQKKPDSTEFSQVVDNEKSTRSTDMAVAYLEGWDKDISGVMLDTTVKTSAYAPSHTTGGLQDWKA